MPSLCPLTIKGKECSIGIVPRYLIGIHESNDHQVPDPGTILSVATFQPPFRSGEPHWYQYELWQHLGGPYKSWSPCEDGSSGDRSPMSGGGGRSQAEPCYLHAAALRAFHAVTNPAIPPFLLTSHSRPMSASISQAYNYHQLLLLLLLLPGNTHISILRSTTSLSMSARRWWSTADEFNPY